MPPKLKTENWGEKKILRFLDELFKTPRKELDQRKSYPRNRIVQGDIRSVF